MTPNTSDNRKASACQLDMETPSEATVSLNVSGNDLYGHVLEGLKKHCHLEEHWHYVVAALFVMQAHIATVLPAVFYVFIGGPKGSGKTNLLSLIQMLTKGLKFENVSVCALARCTRYGGTVCIDEIDVSRGKEQNEVRDALLRQGYKANAAPYTRWNPSTNSPETVPVYGPKAATYRSGLDDALQSRGFDLPSVRFVGRDGYAFVLNGFWPHTDNLPEQLEAWGRQTIRTYDSAKLNQIAVSDAFRAKVEAVVAEFGANRSTELAVVALLVAEIAGVDVLAELRKADVMRATLVDDSEEGIIVELADVVCAIARQSWSSPSTRDEVVVIKQSDIRKELNRRLRYQGERTVSDRRFCSIRSELGVKAGWLAKRGNAVFWELPYAWVQHLPTLTIMATNSGVPVQSSIQSNQGSRGSETLARTSGLEGEGMSGRIVAALSLYDIGRSMKDVELTVGNDTLSLCTHMGLLPSDGW